MRVTKRNLLPLLGLFTAALAAGAGATSPRAEQLPGRETDQFEKMVKLYVLADVCHAVGVAFVEEEVDLLDELTAQQGSATPPDERIRIWRDAQNKLSDGNLASGEWLTDICQAAYAEFEKLRLSPDFD
jgi:hypothetical protein